MPLGPYQKYYLKSIRADERIYGITRWQLTESDIDSDDIYARPTITSGARLFSGAVAWGSTLDRSRSEGGFHQLSDVTIVASLDEKDYLDTENSYLVVDGVNVKIDRMINCPDTDELVVYANRLR